MKLLFLLSSLLFSLPQSYGRGLGNHGLAACQNVTLRPIKQYCAIDLTISLDMSIAMQQPNYISSLGYFAYGSLLTRFPISANYTRVAFQSFGSGGIYDSIWYSNYENLCTDINQQIQNSIGTGMNYANISNVLKYYYNTMVNSGRGPPYPQTYLLYTAISDPNDINAAIPIANQIKAANVTINIVGLGQNSSSPLANLATNYIGLPFIGGPYDASINWATLKSCTYDVTVPTTNVPPMSTPAIGPTYPPNSSYYGTPCAKNAPNAWLDIILVAEASVNMRAQDLNGLGGSFVSALATGPFTITNNATLQHSTRFALITYNSNPKLQWDFTVFGSLNQLLLNLTFIGDQFATTDPNANLFNALQLAQNFITSQISYRRPIIVVAAKSSNAQGGDPSTIANEMKGNDYQLVTINYNPNDLTNSQELSKIASPGMNFTDDNNITSNMNYALLEANCICPLGLSLHQYQKTDPKTGLITHYSDCFLPYPQVSLPEVAQLVCKNNEITDGRLAMQSTQDMLNFEQNIFGNSLTASGYTIGLNRLNNGIWSWFGPNGTYLPLQGFINWCDPSVAANPSSGNYAYLQIQGTCWVPVSATGVVIPSLCQYRSCDTDLFVQGCSWNKQVYTKHDTKN
uniref:VWFA domain-containing protein n=1 Tax=Acrobeloides nanus TaxID=290746 RepID=A0A914EF69_9BILA